jgi:hypothetical protein
VPLVASQKVDQRTQGCIEFRLAFQLDFPGVTIEAAKVVGASKASTPNQLITYFDESHIDLTNVVDTKGQEEVIDIKVQFRASTHRLGGKGL